jgi:hypothetical protein
MRIVPRPRQVGHTEDMGFAWVRDADGSHVVVLGALSTSAITIWLRRIAFATKSPAEQG